jgi:hypothetical protein
LAKGQVLRAQNRPEEAIPEYETVIAFNRNSPHAIAALEATSTRRWPRKARRRRRGVATQAQVDGLRQQLDEGQKKLSGLKDDLRRGDSDLAILKDQQGKLQLSEPTQGELRPA